MLAPVKIAGDGSGASATNSLIIIAGYIRSSHTEWTAVINNGRPARYLGLLADRHYLEYPRLLSLSRNEYRGSQKYVAYKAHILMSTYDRAARILEK